MQGKRIHDIALAHRVDNQLAHIDEQHTVRAPIYIPTRHRAGKTKTTQLLDNCGLPYQLVIEPHDYDSYAAHHTADQLLTLPADNFGLANVRNWILDQARGSGWLYCWEIDDDISGFVYRINGERIHTTPRPLMSIVEEYTFAHDNVAGSCIPNQAYLFGYDQKPSLVYNGMIYQVQLLRTDTEVLWRFGLPDDPDRSLQILTAGWTTIVPRRFGQMSPPPMSQAGGMTTTDYAKDGRMTQFERLVDHWPGAYSISYMLNGTPKLTARKPFDQFHTLPNPTRQPRWHI